MRLQLIPVPVSDVDRAKAFYAEQVGFSVDQDHTISEDLRFVQLTPPGSAPSSPLAPVSPRPRQGRRKGCCLSYPTDIDAARAELASSG